jgi:hypothetical protein
MTANILYALSFSLFNIVGMRFAVFWLWYVRLVFDFISLVILTLTLISIVKLQLENEQFDFDKSEYTLTQSHDSTEMIDGGEQSRENPPTLFNGQV